MSIGDFFKRTLVPVRQRPISRDLNGLQFQIEQQGLGLAGAMFGGSVMAPADSGGGRYSSLGSNGFYAGGFWCVKPVGGPFAIQLNPGIGVTRAGPTSATDIDGAQGADWYYDGQWGAPLVLSQAQSLTVPAPPAVGNSRIDMIEVRADYLANNPQTVGIFDPASETFNPTVANKSLTWDLYGRTGSVNAPNVSTAPISYVVGQNHVGAISGATEPSLTPGYVRVARINLDASGGAIAAVTNSMIVDMRRPLLPNNIVEVSGLAVVPGLLAGVGTEALTNVQLQPGQILKAVVETASAPVAGISYTMTFFLIGGDLRSSISGNYGAGVASPRSEDNRCAAVTSTASGRVDAAVQSILDGTDANYAVVNGAETFAIGTPYCAFTVRVRNPSGGALSSSERFFFHYQLMLGDNP